MNTRPIVKQNLKKQTEFYDHNCQKWFSSWKFFYIAQLIFHRVVCDDVAKLGVFTVFQNSIFNFPVKKTKDSDKKQNENR